MKIAVAGLGYVGLASAVLLAQKNEVCAFDVDTERVSKVNDRRSPIADVELEDFLVNKNLRLSATSDPEVAYVDASYVIVATPTNYDVDTHRSDTKAVEAVIADVLRINSKAVIVIKSTIPVGFVDSMRTQFATKQIIFSPEFLREGRVCIITYILRV